jgi:hypothetical protein
MLSTAVLGAFDMADVPTLFLDVVLDLAVVLTASVEELLTLCVVDLLLAGTSALQSWTSPESFVSEVDDALRLKKKRVDSLRMSM